MSAADKLIDRLFKMEGRLASDEYTAQELGAVLPIKEKEMLTLVADCLDYINDNKDVISEQTKILTNVVNAIRGVPDEFRPWSHRDAAELVIKALKEKKMKLVKPREGVTTRDSFREGLLDVLRREIDMFGRADVCNRGDIHQSNLSRALLENSKVRLSTLIIWLEALGYKITVGVEG